MKTKCVDLAELINRYDHNDYVVVKLDIEGSEYKILPDLLEKGALRKIDAIGVEYHSNLTPHDIGYNTPDSFAKIFNIFGIKLFKWSR